MLLCSAPVLIGTTCFALSTPNFSEASNAALVAFGIPSDNLLNDDIICSPPDTVMVITVTDYTLTN